MHFLKILALAACVGAFVIDLNPPKLTPEQEKAIADITEPDSPPPKSKDDPPKPKDDAPKPNDPPPKPKDNPPKPNDPPPKPKDDPPKGNLTEEQQKALDAHNKARADVKDSQKREPLQWDKGLEQAALKWAQHLASKKSGLEHAKDREGAGENLAQVGAGGKGSSSSMAKSSDMWIGEKKDYQCGVPISTYINNGNFGKIGHYTQVIWPSTTKVGIAEVNGYVVARYMPPGNMNGDSACK